MAVMGIRRAFTATIVFCGLEQWGDRRDTTTCGGLALVGCRVRVLKNLNVRQAVWPRFFETQQKPSSLTAQAGFLG
jgi:hypothetical protein